MRWFSNFGRKRKNQGAPLDPMGKREFIETLWSILVSFVDLSWRLGPDSGDDGKTLDLAAVLAALDSGSGKETE